MTIIEESFDLIMKRVQQVPLASEDKFPTAHEFRAKNINNYDAIMEAIFEDMTVAARNGDDSMKLPENMHSGIAQNFLDLGFSVKWFFEDRQKTYWIYW